MARKESMLLAMPYAWNWGDELLDIIQQVAEDDGLRFTRVEGAQKSQFFEKVEWISEGDNIMSLFIQPVE